MFLLESHAVVQQTTAGKIGVEFLQDSLE